MCLCHLRLIQNLKQHACCRAGTLDAPRLPNTDRQRSGALPAHLALAKDDILPAGKSGSRLKMPSPPKTRME